MHVPEPYALPQEPPEPPSCDDELGAHMREHRVIFAPAPPRDGAQLERPEYPMAFAECNNLYVSWERIFPFSQTDHDDVLALFCKFLYPTVKETENRIVHVNYLRDYQKFHPVRGRKQGFPRAVLARIADCINLQY
jgi:hypothetical protein